MQYGTLTGYVMTSYLVVQEDGVDETPSGVVSLGTATVALSDESQTLNLRAAPTTNAAILVASAPRTDADGAGTVFQLDVCAVWYAERLCDERLHCL